MRRCPASRYPGLKNRNWTYSRLNFPNGCRYFQDSIRSALCGKAYIRRTALSRPTLFKRMTISYDHSRIVCSLAQECMPEMFELCVRRLQTIVQTHPTAFEFERIKRSRL
ncbi:hypothetical protein P692DRAFT_201083312 [Suillus brevipes Sb2]|nr:hypothetical protein P692DRAFT_201083312 [Suillus brevipes Sb2]